MLYIIENNYTRRLYKQLKSLSTDFSLISKNDLHLLMASDTLIVDQEDLNFFEIQQVSRDQMIVLGETLENYKCISKFQSFRQIKTQINSSEFPIFFLTSDKNISFSDRFIDAFSQILRVEYIVSLNYTDKTNFSLYQWSLNPTYDVPRKQIIYLISTVPDTLNSPESDIITFINALAIKGSVLVISYPLKGNLDKRILALSSIVYLITPTLDLNYSNQVRQYIKGNLHFILNENDKYNLQNAETLNQLEQSILNKLLHL